MIKFIVILAVLTGLIIAGPLLSGSQGLLHIEFMDWVVETSVITGVIILALFLLALYMCLWLLFRILGVKTGLTTWFYDLKTNRAEKKFTQALRFYSEGLFDQSCNLVEKNIYSGKINDNFLLMALLASVKTDNVERTNKLFKDAENLKSVNSYAISIIRGQWLNKIGDYTAAESLCEGLFSLGKKSKELLSIYFDALEGQHKYRLIEKKRIQFIKYGVLQEQKYREIISSHVINEINNLTDVYVLRQMVRDMPKDMIIRPEIISTFAARLNDEGDVDYAADIILKQFKNSEKVTDLCCSIATWKKSNPKILQWLEKNIIKLEQNKIQNDDIEAAYANMLANNHEYKKAAVIYERLIARKPSPLYYSRLGYCCQESVGPQKAVVFYREAARLSEIKNNC